MATNGPGLGPERAAGGGGGPSLDCPISYTPKETADRFESRRTGGSRAGWGGGVGKMRPGGDQASTRKPGWLTSRPQGTHRGGAGEGGAGLFQAVTTMSGGFVAEKGLVLPDDSRCLDFRCEASPKKITRSLNSRRTSLLLART